LLLSGTGKTIAKAYRLLEGRTSFGLLTLALRHPPEQVVHLSVCGVSCGYELVIGLGAAELTETVKGQASQRKRIQRRRSASYGTLSQARA
jgi:hypothetical protein